MIPLKTVEFDNLPLKKIENKSKKIKNHYSTASGTVEVITEYLAEDTSMITINLKIISLTEAESEKILALLEPYV